MLSHHFIYISLSIILPLTLTKPPPAPIEDRVVGADLCDLTKFPYLVQIFAFSEPVYVVKSKGQICSGSLITSRWVLTSAHCVYSTSRWKTRLVYVRKADSLYQLDKVAKKAERVIPHELYKGGDLYDVALVYPDGPIEATLYIATMLPPRGFDKSAACKEAQVVGWGHDNASMISTDPLVATCGVVYPVAKKTMCSLDSVPTKTYLQLDGSFIYVKVDKIGRDACIGDAGGPLVCGEKIIGIVHGGYSCGIYLSCSLYVKIEAYYTFIHNYTGVAVPFNSSPTDSIYADEYIEDLARAKKKELNHGAVGLPMRFSGYFIVICTVLYYLF